MVRLLCLLAGLAVASLPAAAGSSVQLAGGKSAEVRLTKWLEVIAADTNRTLMRRRANDRQGSIADAYFVGAKSIWSEGREYVLLVIERHSVPTQGLGSCTAGIEVALHLLEVRRNPTTLVIRDKVDLESCVSVLSLSDDSGATLRDRMDRVADARCLSLQWVRHPKFDERRVGVDVSRGRFRFGRCGPDPVRSKGR